MVWIICSAIVAILYVCWLVYEAKHAPTLNDNFKLIDLENDKNENEDGDNNQ